MSARFALRPTTALLAVLALGCSDPLGPEDFAGTYALQRVGQDPLPAVLFVTEYGTTRVLADTLRLGANGRGAGFHVSTSEPRDGGEPVGPQSYEQTFSFAVRARQVYITYDCPPNANCAPGPHLTGRLTGEGLQLHYNQTVNDSSSLDYARVAMR